jgi:hypothetical protein
MFNLMTLFRKIGKKKRQRIAIQKAIEERMAKRAAAEKEAKRYAEFLQHLQEISRITQEYKQSQNDIY